MWWVLRTYLWYLCLTIGLGLAAAWLPGYMGRVSVPVDYDRDCGDVDPGSFYWLTKPPLAIGTIVAFRTGVASEQLGFGRIVANPGDGIELKNGDLLINGTLSRHWRPVNLHHGIGTLGRQRVPATHVFIVSDNHRADSVQLGPIPLSAVLGGIRE